VVDLISQVRLAARGGNKEATEEEINGIRNFPKESACLPAWGVVPFTPVSVNCGHGILYEDHMAEPQARFGL